MWWWHDGGWLTWLLMVASMAAFWGVVAWLVVTTVRPGAEERHATPEAILERRLARGELDVEEYRQLRDELSQSRH